MSGEVRPDWRAERRDRAPCDRAVTICHITGVPGQASQESGRILFRPDRISVRERQQRHPAADPSSHWNPRPAEVRHTRVMFIDWGDDPYLSIVDTANNTIAARVRIPYGDMQDVAVNVAGTRAYVSASHTRGISRTTTVLTSSRL